MLKIAGRRIEFKPKPASRHAPTKGGSGFADDGQEKQFFQSLTIAEATGATSKSLYRKRPKTLTHCGVIAGRCKESKR